MATKGKFHIPSIGEMKKQDKIEPKIVSNFATSRSKGSSHTSDLNAGSSKPISKIDTSVPEYKTSSASGHAESFPKPKCQGPQTSVSQSTQPASSSSKPPCSPLKSGMRNLTSPQSSPVKAAPSNSIVVSARQRGNPILKHIRNIPWEYGDIVPDYQLGQTSCALFLSLRYHQLNPNYIHERLKQLGHTFDLRVLLVHVDIKDPHPCLKDLAKMCLLADCTLILAFNPEEAGRYLETYKSYESKPPDLIMERTEGNLMARMTDTLTKVRSVNKTDAMTLMSAFGSFRDIVNASFEDISLCPGFGPQKAKRLHSVLNEPFLKAKRKCISGDEQKQATQENKKIQDDSSHNSSPRKKTPQKKTPQKKTPQKIVPE